MVLTEAQWMPDQNLLGIRNYGKYDAVNYVRTFLGHELIFVPVNQVLIFSLTPDLFRVNPFIKQALDSVHYNQIEIIAYDDGYFGGSKEAYRKVLDQCGYFYIKTIVLSSEFRKKQCNYTFFQEMIKTYNKENKKYGMISNRMNIYAKLKHLDFLLYTSPDIYPRRYYFGKHLKIEERAVQNFINEELFSGMVKETRGYHFGFAFEGLLIYNFIRFLKKEKERQGASILYFTADNGMVCEAYMQLYPEDYVQTIYVDSRTVRDEELKEYLLHHCKKQNSMLADITISSDFKTYIKQCLGADMTILTLDDYFPAEVIKKYNEDIEHAIDMAKESCFFVKQYKDGNPVWEEIETDMKTMGSMQEVHRGAVDFARKFDEMATEYKEIYHCYGEACAMFTAKVIHYAFDKEERRKVHMEPMQRITKSKKIKAVFHLIKRFYKFVKEKR